MPDFLFQPELETQSAGEILHPLQFHLYVQMFKKQVSGSQCKIL